jgi:hypothetical protein
MKQPPFFLKRETGEKGETGEKRCGLLFKIPCPRGCRMIT